MPMTVGRYVCLSDSLHPDLVGVRNYNTSKYHQQNQHIMLKCGSREDIFLTVMQTVWKLSVHLFTFLATWCWVGWLFGECRCKTRCKVTAPVRYETNGNNLTFVAKNHFLEKSVFVVSILKGAATSRNSENVRKSRKARQNLSVKETKHLP
jgi:hypothetical protein